jgi:superfamily II DNA/RNA helicase
VTTFADLGVDQATVDVLAARGIISPFPIQEMAIPLAMGGHDLIGQARTGTGKTLAFGLPLLARIDHPGDGMPQALAVVPTRELAIQVAHDLERAAPHARILTVYGGRSYEPQVEALTRGVDVVVGTPGRLIDLARQKVLNLGQVKVLVLDEADEMLDLGFLPEVEKIVAMTPPRRQTLLFSATMPGPVVALSRRYMTSPTHIRAEEPEETQTVPTTTQFVYRAHALDKIEMLARILQAEGRGLTIVFCRTKRNCQRVSDDLTERGFAAGAVHGDLGQGQREQALRAFRAGKVDVLVATDVAARGIDVTGVTHVVNYTCPEDEKTYLHRIGRTGRAGESGTAITFVDWEDLARWQMINAELGLNLAEPPETYSSSPSLLTDLGIPQDVTGVLPRAQRTRAGLAAEEVEDLGGRPPRGADKPRSAGGGRGHSADRGRGDGSRSGSSERSSSEASGRTRTRRRTRVSGSGESTGPEASAPSPAGEQSTSDSAPARRRRRRRSRSGAAAAEHSPEGAGLTGPAESD